MANDLVPSDESAKALQEVSKFGCKSIEGAQQLCQWFGKVLGTTAEDAAGILVADPLRMIRISILAWYSERVEAIHKKRGTKTTESLSPSLALPLLQAAQDETQETLRELWARLIANAMDPSRKSLVRPSFVELLRKFDPLDAKALEMISKMNIHVGKHPGPAEEPISIDRFAGLIKADALQAEVSLGRLVDLKCLSFYLYGNQANKPTYLIAPLGQQLVAAIQE